MPIDQKKISYGSINDRQLNDGEFNSDEIREITSILNVKLFKILGESKEEGKYQESIHQVPHLTQDTIWESDKTQENIAYNRAKRSVLSQQVTTIRQGIYKTVRQTNIKTNNKKDPQKKHRLGTVSKKITQRLKGEVLFRTICLKEYMKLKDIHLANMAWWLKSAGALNFEL